MKTSIKYEREKTKRQELIKGWNQKRLKKAIAFIAGVGALGNEVAKNLAQVGIGKLILVDMDEIEYSNLNRTVLFQNKDVGKKKAVIAARALKRIAPNMKIEVETDTLQSIISKKDDLFKDVDIIMGCLDNMEARFLLNHVSVRFRIPYVDGGYMGFGGSVQVVVPPYTPCLECNVTNATYANIGRRYSCTAGDFVNLTDEERRVRIPAISVTASIISAIQSKEALKILLGMEDFRRSGIWPTSIGKPVKNVLQYDGRTNRVLTTRLEKNPECYVCGSNYDASLASAHYPREEIKINSNLSLKKLKEKIQTQTKKPRVNLIANFEAIPNFEEAYEDLQAIRTQIRFIIRGYTKAYSNREHVIDKDFDDVQQILESPLLSDPETIFNSLSQNPVYLANLKRLVKKICKKVYRTNSLREHVGEELMKIYDRLVRLEKTFSETVSISVVGFKSMQEVYAVNPKNGKTVDDTLILLSIGD